MTAKKRGRPRSTASHDAILKSTLAILDENGLSGISIEAVAARAKVGKPTIYRYWANAQELAMSALMGEVPDLAGAPSLDVGLETLQRQLRNVIERFSTKSGKQATMLLAAADLDSEISKAFRNQVILKSRTEGRAILEGILSDSPQPLSHPVETLLDMIYGPIFYRLLTRQAPLEERLADDIVNVVAALVGRSDSSRGDQP